MLFCITSCSHFVCLWYPKGPPYSALNLLSLFPEVSEVFLKIRLWVTCRHLRIPKCAYPATRHGVYFSLQEFSVVTGMITCRWRHKEPLKQQSSVSRTSPFVRVIIRVLHTLWTKIDNLFLFMWCVFSNIAPYSDYCFHLFTHFSYFRLHVNNRRVLLHSKAISWFLRLKTWNLKEPTVWHDFENSVVKLIK